MKGDFAITFAHPESSNILHSKWNLPRILEILLLKLEQFKALSNLRRQKFPKLHFCPDTNEFPVCVYLPASCQVLLSSADHARTRSWDKSRSKRELYSLTTEAELTAIALKFGYLENSNQKHSFGSKNHTHIIRSKA